MYQSWERPESDISRCHDVTSGLEEKLGLTSTMMFSSPVYIYFVLDLVQGITREIRELYINEL